MNNSTQVCKKEKLYRVDKNKFTLLYDGKEDIFNLGVKDWSNLNFNDLKDLHNLTRRILRYTKNEK